MASPFAMAGRWVSRWAVVPWVRIGQMARLLWASIITEVVAHTLASSSTAMT